MWEGWWAQLPCSQSSQKHVPWTLQNRCTARCSGAVPKNCLCAVFLACAAKGWGIAADVQLQATVSRSHPGNWEQAGASEQTRWAAGCNGRVGEMSDLLHRRSPERLKWGINVEDWFGSAWLKQTRSPGPSCLVSWKAFCLPRLQFISRSHETCFQNGKFGFSSSCPSHGLLPWTYSPWNGEEILQLVRVFILVRHYPGCLGVFLRHWVKRCTSELPISQQTVVCLQDTSVSLLNSFMLLKFFFVFLHNLIQP